MEQVPSRDDPGGDIGFVVFAEEEFRSLGLDEMQDVLEEWKRWMSRRQSQLDHVDACMAVELLGGGAIDRTLRPHEVVAKVAQAFRSKDFFMECFTDFGFSVRSRKGTRKFVYTRDDERVFSDIPLYMDEEESLRIDFEDLERLEYPVFNFLYLRCCHRQMVINQKAQATRKRKRGELLSSTGLLATSAAPDASADLTLPSPGT